MNRIFYFIPTVILALQLGALPTFASDKGLPFEPDTTKVSLNPITKGTTAQLNFLLTLPPTQKLNHGAPSFVAVYEKTGKSEWKEVQKFDLNQFFTTNDEIHFNKSIQLQNENSEVAVHSTIYHCGKEHKTACYIQGYLGKTKRQVKGSANSELDFIVEAHLK